MEFGPRRRRCSPGGAADARGLWLRQALELEAAAQIAYGAINAGDLDAFLELTAEDVEFTSLVAEAEGATFRGHEGVRAW